MRILPPLSACCPRWLRLRHRRTWKTQSNAYCKYIRDEGSQHRSKGVKPYLSGQEYSGNSFEEHQECRQVHPYGLDNALVEAHSQRIRAQKATEISEHRLWVERGNAQRLQRARLGENSLLIAECSSLRGQ